MNDNNVAFLWTSPTVVGSFRTGVSLHSHTMHSRESLSFVPEYAAKVPLLAWELARQQEKYKNAKGSYFDFQGSFWTPPLHSHAALELERKQIQNVLGLRGFVSLSDHDSIEAGAQLQVVHKDMPISVEWTVPIRDTYFHLGVHNLPPDKARSCMADLAAFTAAPSERRLRELLDLMHSWPETLIVLNHPMWDQVGLGSELHWSRLQELISIAGKQIHAVELNGLRPWGENRTAGKLASELGYPLISGGDRHGHEPNAVLNLTNATSFSDFIEEIRSGLSQVLFMPQYQEPLTLRCMKTLCDVLREHPEMAGHERWNDRVYYSPTPDQCVPISTAMKGCGPAVLKYFLAATNLLAHRRVQRALRLCLTEEHEFAL